jgi:Phage integrase family
VAGKRPFGLIKRGRYWWIELQLRGRRIRKSTKCELLEDAIEVYDFERTQLRDEINLGRTAAHSFGEALDYFIKTNGHLRSINNYAGTARLLDAELGEVPLDRISQATMQPFLDMLQQKGLKPRSRNYYLKLTQRVLNLAAGTWEDANGKHWLAAVPKFEFADERPGRRKRYPLSPSALKVLLRHCPIDLRRLAAFAALTGERSGVVSGLLWEWEETNMTLGKSVFEVPGDHVKNQEDRTVLLNSAARKIIESQRDRHPTHVFLSDRTLSPYRKMPKNAWMTARRRAADSLEETEGVKAPWGFRNVRFHDLKHTLGDALSAKDINKEHRKCLLGHTDKHITNHYSPANIKNLLMSSEKVVEYYNLSDEELGIV